MRRIVLGLATAFALVATLGVSAGLALADRWWPAPDAAAAPAVEVDVPAGRTDLVCPGPPRLAAEDADLTFDPQFDPAPAAATTSARGFVLGRGEGLAPAGGYVPALAADEETTSALGPPGAAAGAVLVDGVSSAGTLSADPADGAAPLLAGATVARSDEGDLRGLAGARCLEPTASAWFVAGSTDVGSSARLVLANAGRTPATVAVEAWGEVGPVELGQASSVLVPAGAERSVLLEAFAPDRARLALRLTVAGGQVAAFLQDSALNGFVPAGVDLAGPAVEPARAVLVPGVVLPETDIDDAVAAGLRVVNPGQEAATVRVRLLSGDGEVAVPGAEEIVVEAGTVSAVSLAGVPAGAYTADVVSDQPVTAGVMLVRVGGPSADDPDQRVVDRAWVAAAAPVGTALVPLPAVDAGQVSVVVGNPAATETRLQARVVRPDGAVTTLDPVTLAARSTTVLESDALAGAVGVELVALDAAGDPAEAGVVAALVLVGEAEDGPLITAIAAQPDLETTRIVPVRLPYR